MFVQQRIFSVEQKIRADMSLKRQLWSFEAAFWAAVGATEFSASGISPD